MYSTLKMSSSIISLLILDAGGPLSLGDIEVSALSNSTPSMLNFYCRIHMVVFVLFVPGTNIQSLLIQGRVSIQLLILKIHDE